MVQDENSAKLGVRRNIKNLTSIQASVKNDLPTSRWRRNRPVLPPPEQNSQVRIPASDAPPKSPPKLEHRQSKMSLFNLFSRPKVERARGHHEPGLAVPEEEPRSPTLAPIQPIPKPTVWLNPVNVIPPPPQVQPDSTPKPMSQKGSIVKRPRQPSIHWDPPPLFQAYPQAIKHATLQASTSSPDVLLRTQSQRKVYNVLQENIGSKLDITLSAEGDPDDKKSEKAKSSNKRLASSIVANTPELTTKIYVLVTSGYVLQYAGDGPFDRLPEKVLQLGKESAAFACDLIPGKHWVLQISQTAKEDGTVSMVPQKSFLSRLRLQNASARRTATSFLLVLESAEEMDSWLTAVRKEIDALGGMKCRPDSEPDSNDSGNPVEKQLQEKLGHRFLVQRDPNRFNNNTPVRSPDQSPVDSPTIAASDWERSRRRTRTNGSDAASTNSSRYNSVRQSTEAPSIATTIISNEQLQLNQLRESSRLSYMSSGTSGTGTVTVTTSRGSSPAPNSPRAADAVPKPEPEPLRTATSLKSFHMNPNTASSNRRRSMQTLPTTNEDQSLSSDLRLSRPQRHSTYGPPLGPTAQENQIPPSAHFNARSSLNQSPIKSTPWSRSSSAPPARLPLLPTTSQMPTTTPARPGSTLGSLPSAAILSAHSVNRPTPSPKPFFPPLPIRTQDSNGPLLIPRRFSSLSPPPLPIGIAINRAVSSPPTLPPPPPSPPHPHPQSHQQHQASQPKSLRRPTSMQIRSDPAPFLSSSRPITAYSRVSNSSFPPPVRSSPGLGTVTHSHTHLNSTAVPAPKQRVQSRRSMPVMGLPPPAPPPNMPLPPPPPIALRLAPSVLV